MGAGGGVAQRHAGVRIGGLRGGAHHHHHRRLQFPASVAITPLRLKSSHAAAGTAAIGHFHHQDLAAHLLRGEGIQRRGVAQRDLEGGGVMQIGGHGFLNDHVPVAAFAVSRVNSRPSGFGFTDW